jgi:2-hydroxychromene-2-carboxylate isomerase
MVGTRRLRRFKGITSLGYIVPRLLAIGSSMRMRVLVRRTTALRDVTTDAVLPGLHRRRHAVEPPVALTAMVRRAGMLDRITIAGNGIRT